MRRKQPSRIALWVRLLLLAPLPIIGLLIILAGQSPRQGLFDAELAAQGLGGGATDQWAPLPAYLPESDFTLVDTIQHYGESNLYVKINGHDVAFFRFGFVGLTFASYSGDGSAFVDVYAYRMNRRENALGIFANERSDTREPMQIRDAGYRSGGGVFFYRGPWYIQIIPSEVSELTQRATAELVDSLQVILPAPAQPLPQLQWFPSEGRVTNSEGFVPSDAFGTEFMGDVFTAEYQADGNRLRAFRHSSDSAAGVYQQFVDFLSERATALGPVEVESHEVERFSSYGEETWVGLISDNIVGLDRVTDSAFAQSLCGRLADIADNDTEVQK